MNEFLKQFDAIILDMNNTFMFEGDRFSLSEDYFKTYCDLGGCELKPALVRRLINGAFVALDEVYHDEEQHDEFPSISDALKQVGEPCQVPLVERQRLVDLFAIHEVGAISPEYVQAIGKLASTHRLHLVSNIWAPKDRFLTLLEDSGCLSFFESITFSSDSKSVKPSENIFAEVLRRVDSKKAVLIGDCLRCDIAAAQKLGMASVWLSHGRAISQEDPRPSETVIDLLSLVGTNPCNSVAITNKALQINNQVVRLRPTIESDLDFVLIAENDKENAPSIVNWPRSKHRASIEDGNVAHLIVENMTTGERVGFLIIRGVSDNTHLDGGPIELKRLVITEKRKGFGRASLELLKVLVFEKLKRRRLWLNVVPFNARARSLYRSTGFQYEGTWRDSFLTDNGFSDLELMTVLSTDAEVDSSFEANGIPFRFTRNFSSKHIQQFFELYDQQWPSETRTHEDLHQAILGSEFAIGAVEVSTDNLVGFCRVVTDRGFRAWLYGLVVREDRRGMGLGRELIQQALADHRLMGHYDISLTCHRNMNRFYRKFGFQAIENETVMRLPLRER